MMEIKFKMVKKLLFIVLLFIAFVGNAQTTISDGTLKATVVGNEKIPVGGSGHPVINTNRIYTYMKLRMDSLYYNSTTPLSNAPSLTTVDGKTTAGQDINSLGFLASGALTYRRNALIDDNNLSARVPSIKGVGQVQMTNGSAAVVGVGTNFSNATFYGLSFWTDFWVQDSGGNWWRGASKVSTDNTHVAFNLWYSYSDALGGYITSTSTTFPGVSGTYDWLLKHFLIIMV